MATPEIQSRVIDRLVDTGKADEPWALVVLAAMEGEQELNGFLDKARTIAPPQRSESSTAPPSEPPGAYVGSISVEGFRGVGPAATLALRPGPVSPSSSGAMAPASPVSQRVSSIF